MRTRRGSVAIIAMIMIVCTASVALTMVSLSGAMRTKQVRLQHRRIVQNAFDGGVDCVEDMALRGVLRPPQTVSLTVGDVQESLALTDVSSLTVSLLGITITTSAPTLKIDGTLTYRGETYHMQQIVGRGVISTVWQYAIYTDNGISTLSALKTGSAGYEGDAWFNGNVVLLNGGSHFSGDLISTGLIVPTPSVDGSVLQNKPSIDFPTVSANTYQSAATSMSLTGTIHGYVFASANASGYPLLYSNGNTAISGSFTGSGTIFVNGSVTIDGDLTETAGDHLAIIANGDVALSSACTQVQAYIYSAGKFSSGSGGAKTVLGGIVTRTINLNANLSTSFDPAVRDLPVAAYNLKLPGVWP